MVNELSQQTQRITHNLDFLLSACDNAVQPQNVAHEGYDSFDVGLTPATGDFDASGG